MHFDFLSPIARYSLHPLASKAARITLSSTLPRSPSTSSCGCTRVMLAQSRLYVDVDSEIIRTSANTLRSFKMYSIDSALLLLYTALQFDDTIWLNVLKSVSSLTSLVRWPKILQTNWGSGCPFRVWSGSAKLNKTMTLSLSMISIGPLFSPPLFQVAGLLRHIKVLFGACFSYRKQDGFETILR